MKIQFQPRSAGAYRTLANVPIDNPGGYFEVKQSFPTSGTVRLMWSYPTGQAVYSRTVAVNAG